MISLNFHGGAKSPRGHAPEVMGELERKMGFEPTTLSLARRCSTTEPLPLAADAVCAKGWRCAEGQSRTGDTGIFSAVLYHLSYLGIDPHPTPAAIIVSSCGAPSSATPSAHGEPVEPFERAIVRGLRSLPSTRSG